METLIVGAVALYILYKSGILDILVFIIGCFAIWPLCEWTFSVIFSREFLRFLGKLFSLLLG